MLLMWVTGCRIKQRNKDDDNDEKNRDSHRAYGRQLWRDRRNGRDEAQAHAWHAFWSHRAQST
ncbi:hypothetical protein GCM10023333_15000 [Ferrimonas pelagia]|uniref:Lipoprotein n=1 Tax=Ferrimonas pelagia TaxID=1177826 RepID=A0ABP9EKV4_9GAMM